MDALFTSTSAVTITGLSVINIGHALTTTGQIILLFLIQIGGLGFMTFAILAALSLAPQLGLKQQIMAQDSIGHTSLSKVTFVAQAVFIYTLIFELIGTVILTVVWTSQFGFTRAVLRHVL